MKKILLVLILLVGFNSTAWASLIDVVGAPDKAPISVVVFMNKQVFADSKAVTEIRDVLKEKFKYAKSVAIFGDDQAKSPEFLEFVEKVQTDPLNEKGIKGISFGALAQYGRTTKSNYIVLIVIAPFNSQSYGYGDIKAQVSVLDVASLKNVECLNWYKEGASWTSGAKDLIKKVASDFNWSPPAATPSDKKTINQVEEKKPSETPAQGKVERAVAVLGVPVAHVDGAEARIQAEEERARIPEVRGGDVGRPGPHVARVGEDSGVDPPAEGQVG